jgi:hypothetical protein
MNISRKAILDLVISVTEARSIDFDVQSLALILWDYAKLGLKPEPFLSAAVRITSQRIHLLQLSLHLPTL